MVTRSNKSFPHDRSNIAISVMHLCFSGPVPFDCVNLQPSPQKSLLAKKDDDDEEDDNDNDDHDDGTRYDVRYGDGDYDRGLQKRSVVRAHPWTLRNFIMAIRERGTVGLLRGQVAIQEGCSDAQLYQFLYEWKTCEGRPGDTLQFAAVYQEFGTDILADCTRTEDALRLPDPNIVFLDVLQSAPKSKEDDRVYANLVDYWTHEVCFCGFMLRSWRIFDSVCNILTMDMPACIFTGVSVRSSNCQSPSGQCTTALRLTCCYSG